MKILITGATGFIGTQLIQFLKRNLHDLIILSRNPEQVSDSSILAIKSLNELEDKKSIDVIVNLAGAPIDKRWTQSYKNTLVDSRVHITKDIVDWIALQETKPKLLISASAIGYYGAQGTEPLDEESDAHDEFTHQLCQQWETTALKAQELGVRTCITRFGVVLGKNGGALKKMLPTFRVGLGGVLGDGKQIFSWVHIDDVCRAIIFLIEHTELSGVFNVAAPDPDVTTNKKLTLKIGRVLQRPSFFVIPGALIKLIYGEMGDRLLLHGQNVIPRRLKKAGFKFSYPLLSPALESIIK